MTLVEAQQVSQIAQNIMLTIAGIFTAWWAYSTFGHKEKSDELKALSKKITEIHAYIETAAIHSTMFDLMGQSDEDRRNRSSKIEAKFLGLLEELSELQDISLNVPASFRILTVLEYKSKMIFGYRDSNKWNDEKVKSELLQLRVKILNDIAQEANAYKSIFRRVGITFQNILYRLKGN